MKYESKTFVGEQSSHFTGCDGLIRSPLISSIYMAITKAKKQTILTKLEEIKKNSDTVVFVNFKGVTVKDTTAMRRAMREAGVGYFVAKKTLLKRVFTGYEGEIGRASCRERV